MPDETLLRGWVKQYKAQARDSQEIPAPPVPPTPAPTDVPPKYPPQAPVSVTPVSATPGSPSPVSVTQLLRDFDPPAKSAGPSPPVREAEPPPMPPPPRPLPPLSSAGGQSGCTLRHRGPRKLRGFRLRRKWIRMQAGPRNRFVPISPPGTSLLRSPHRSRPRHRRRAPSSASLPAFSRGRSGETFRRRLQR